MVRHRDVIPAVVTAEGAVFFVVGKRDVAVGAQSGPAACSAGYEGRKAPSVLEKHHLTASKERLVDAVKQNLVEMRKFFAAFCGCQRIRYDHLR